MIVLDETLTLSPSDTAKHIAIPFSLPADGTELRIRYRYTPKRYEGEDAVDQVVACYGRYGLDCTESFRSTISLRCPWTGRTGGSERRIDT